MAMVRRKGPITWKQPPAQAAPVLPPPRHHDKEVPAAKLPEWVHHMYFGQAFTVCRPMCWRPIQRELPPPFPYIEECRRGQVVNIPTGSLAMFVGTVRVSEAGKQGMLSLVRNVFLVNGQRFLVTAYECLVLVEEEGVAA